MNQRLNDWLKENPVGTVVLGLVLDDRHAGGFCVDLGHSIEGHVDILNYCCGGRKVQSVDDYPRPGNAIRCEVLGSSAITNQVHLRMVEGDEWTEVQATELTSRFDAKGVFEGDEYADVNSMLRSGFEIIFIEKCSGVFVPRESSSNEVALRLCGVKRGVYIGKRVTSCNTVKPRGTKTSPHV